MSDKSDDSFISAVFKNIAAHTCYQCNYINYTPCTKHTCQGCNTTHIYCNVCMSRPRCYNCEKYNGKKVVNLFKNKNKQKKSH